MSVAEQPVTYGDIVVVGGGCYGSYYVRQLTRARAAAAIIYDRITVVDRHPDCAVAQAGLLGEQVQLAVEEWQEFFDAYLDRAAADTRDAIVPSPLMPHLMYQWLVRRAQRRWPDRDVRTVPLPLLPQTPWERAAPDGTHYVSFATWMCPINCIEPRLCPHTRDERSWSMPIAAEQLVARSATESPPADRLAGPVIFHCTHRSYGVGMFDTRAVIAADALVSDVAATSPASILVGTVSHCHGALNVLHVGPTGAWM